MNRIDIKVYNINLPSVVRSFTADNSVELDLRLKLIDMLWRGFNHDQN